MIILCLSAQLFLEFANSRPSGLLEQTEICMFCSSRHKTRPAGTVLKMLSS